ncbi:MAG: NAD-dependent succinate-semialdehyde dehydrogenase [Candidatus Methylomirabilales bacterium]
MTDLPYAKFVDRPQRMLIGGAWLPAQHGRTFPVVNPANGEQLAEVPYGGTVEAHRAVEAAHEAFPTWAEKPAGQRAEFLLRAGDRVLADREQLARLLTAESGKPITEARGEIAYTAGFLQFAAEECKRIGGRTIPPSLPSRRLLTIQQPIGVAAAITIWNFPAAAITRPVGPALAAGCTVVVKPDERTPLTAIAVCEALEEGGKLPPGVLNLVTGDAPAIGQAFLENPSVRKINFTGSTDVGRHIMRHAADQVKRLTLELGGHAPFIVFDDADLEAAVQSAVASKFRNAGQTCVCANRIYIHERIFEPFAARFTELARSLTVGDPQNETVKIGPLIDKEGYEKVSHHVEDARNKGAKVLCGGRLLEGKIFSGGFYFEPTVLTGVTDRMVLMQEETFGPVAPLASFSEEIEVITAANATPYGLAAYCYTRDVSRVFRMAEQLQFGVVGINDPFPGTPQAPFGGWKASGIGKEGGQLGLENFLETKLISWGL